MKHTIILTAIALAAAAGSASAGVANVRYDTNNLTASAGGPFGGTTHTGAITITHNATSTLNGIVIFGVSQPFTGALASFSATINLVNGFVTTGSLSTVLTDGSRYDASINGGGGRVVFQAGRGFRIDGLTFNGNFSNLVGGTNFGGVNVAAAVGAGASNYDGSFLLTSFNPDASGVTNQAQFETYIFPTPGSAALLGLAGLAAARRRR